MTIERQYVTFEQAKLLKEKGFIKENGCACREGWVNYLQSFTGATGEPENDSGYVLDTLGNSHLIERPEQWQVVEWLRIEHDIWVSIQNQKPRNELRFEAYVSRVLQPPYNINGLWQYLHLTDLFSTPQEAYSAAFNYVLKELI